MQKERLLASTLAEAPAPAPPADLERLLTTAAAAALVGVSPSTLNKLRVHGGGPVYVKIQRSVRYERSALIAYLHSRSRTSTSDSGAHATP